MECKDDETRDYTHWFHKNIKFNGDYDFKRFENAIENNPSFKCVKMHIYKMESNSSDVDKTVKLFLCAKCNKIFELCSAARGERYYETGYYKQVNYPIEHKSILFNILNPLNERIF